MLHEDAIKIRDLLESAGFNALVLDESSPTGGISNFYVYLIVESEVFALEPQTLTKDEFFDLYSPLVVGE